MAAALAEQGPVRLLRYRRTLGARDFEDLRWYFTSGGHGVFSASSFGHMLERAALMGNGTEPCLDCGGDRESGRAGTGFVASKTARTHTPDDMERELLALIGIEDPDLPAPLADQVCGRCRGMGFTVRSFPSHAKGPLTARMTGSSKRGGSSGVDVGHENLARLGLVSRRLARAEKLQPGISLVFEAYFLAPETDRIFGLLEMTGPGKKLLRNNPQKLTPMSLLLNEWEELKRTRDARKRALFTAARADAEELFGAALAVWNEAQSL